VRNLDDDDDNNNNNSNNNNATKILQTEKDSKFRVCHQVEETVDHIMSACPILEEQYIK
jgi:hypothetical protein